MSCSNISKLSRMKDNSETPPKPKALADILAEELDGAIGVEGTQELETEEKQPLLEAIYERIHAEQPERSALCLSGGGIRSAIFGLGILQGLAAHDLLTDFDYLSTVSGGGYVGGWLTAWIKHHPAGAAGVAHELKKRPDSPLNPEPQPVRHLRSFSNYLTPKTGLTSVDSWTLIATYIRNMFLNWLVLISWLAAAMMVPRLFLAAILLPPTGWTQSASYLQILAQYDLTLRILISAAFVLIASAMAYAIVDVPASGDAKLSQKDFLKFRQIPLLIAALALTEWWALYSNVHGNAAFNSRMGIFQFVTYSVGTYLAGGLLGSIALRFRKDRQPARGRLVASLLRLGTILITTIFGGVCLWALATRVFVNPGKIALNYACSRRRCFSLSCSLLTFFSPVSPAGFRKMKIANGGRVPPLGF